MSFVGQNPKFRSVTFEGFANFAAADATPKREGRLVWVQDEDLFYQDSGSALTSLSLGAFDAVDTKANLDALGRVLGKFYLASDEEIPYFDDGTSLLPFIIENSAVANQNVSNKSVITPVRLDVKQDTEANLETYAATASNGQLCFATDTKVMYQVVDSALVGVGAGAGSYDIFYQENFAQTDAADLTVGNNATFLGAGAATANPGDEVTTPISNGKSLNYVQVAGSLNDFGALPAHTLELKQKGNASGMVAYTTYSGDSGDMNLVFYGVTTGAVLKSVPIEASTVPLRHNFGEDIPSGETAIRVGYHVIVENIGAKLILDQIEGSTNPFVSQNLLETNSVSLAGNDGRVITAGTEDIHFTGSGTGWTSTGDTHYYTVQNDDSVISLVAGSFLTAVANTAMNLYKNGASYKAITDLGNTDRRRGSYVSEQGEFVAGDQLSFRYPSAGGTLLSNTSIHYLNIVEQWESPHIVTPSSVAKQYSEAAGDFTVTGTNFTTATATAVPYKTGDGTWRLKFNIDGDLSVLAADFTATISGVTFKTGTQQAVSASGSGADNVQIQTANGGTGNIRYLRSSAGSAVYLSGDVELDGKPTWADDVSANFLAAFPYQTVTLTLSDDAGFSSGGSLKVERIFDQVTLTLRTSAAHASSAGPGTAAGFLPTWARASSNQMNVFYEDGAVIRTIYTTSSGAVSFEYRDWAGAANAQTSTTDWGSITYSVD